MKLIIVESPNKTAKIQAIVGDDFKVEASVGHIRDLPIKELAIDRKNGYQLGFVESKEKHGVIQKLRSLVKQVGKENVILLTDPDREGEAIAESLAVVLGIPISSAKRAVFYEITEAAILNALANIGTLNINLIEAQKARRAIDRLCGWEVTQLLWRKVKGGVSAGRVQSVALRLCVDRERRILSFRESFSFKVSGLFSTPMGEIIKATHIQSFATIDQSLAYLRHADQCIYRVLSIDTNPFERQPKPAFTTSTLQQVAIKEFSSSENRWSAKKVMEIAQQLFANGHITYMRTDSPNLAESAIVEIRNFVSAIYGSAYFQSRKFKAKESAQEAHEAIRPTHMEVTDAGFTDDERRLYRLIHSRAIASQMRAAQYCETTLSIGSQHPGDVYTAKVKVLTFPGFLAAYDEHVDNDESENPVLKHVSENMSLKTVKIESKQTYTNPEERFDEATLVKIMENKGIGRPSTYASILDKIIYKKYVENKTMPGRLLPVTVFTLHNGVISQSQSRATIGAAKDKLVPTELGIAITQFLEEHFAMLVDYSFTAEIEAMLDDITEGKMTYQQVMYEYDKQHSALIHFATEQTKDVESERKLRIVGQLSGENVSVGKTDRGTYIIYKNEYFPCLDYSPEEITLDIAQNAIATKFKKIQEYEANTVATIGKYKVRNGQYGLYVTDGVNSASLKDYTINQVTLMSVKDLKEIISKSKNSKRKCSSDTNKNLTEKTKRS